MYRIHEARVGRDMGGLAESNLRRLQTRNLCWGVGGGLGAILPLRAPPSSQDKHTIVPAPPWQQIPATWQVAGDPRKANLTAAPILGGPEFPEERIPAWAGGYMQSLLLSCGIWPGPLQRPCCLPAWDLPPPTLSLHKASGKVSGLLGCLPPLPGCQIL